MKKTLLSSKKLSNLGSELTDIMNILEMNNIAMDAVGLTYKTDTETFNFMAKEYMLVAYEQNKNIYNRLEEIALLLLNNDDSKELEALGNESTK